MGHTVIRRQSVVNRLAPQGLKSCIGYSPTRKFAGRDDATASPAGLGGLIDLVSGEPPHRNGPGRSSVKAYARSELSRRSLKSLRACSRCSARHRRAGRKSARGRQSSWTALGRAGPPSRYRARPHRSPNAECTRPSPSLGGQGPPGRAHGVPAVPQALSEQAGRFFRRVGSTFSCWA